MLFDLVIFVVFFIISIFAIRKILSSFNSERDKKDKNLTDGLANGGVGATGRVAGRVDVCVTGDENGTAAVCISRDLNVIYWWKTDKQQTNEFLGEILNNEEYSARSIIAAIRLWGKNWREAERVNIYTDKPVSSKLQMLVLQQVEDCQNKFGVKVTMHWLGNGNCAGGLELVEQLKESRGPSHQAKEGFHNNNLRVFEDSVFQLVNQSSTLASNLFSI